jgi:hypothetical protein
MEQKFLAVLESRGGKSGNQRLREALGGEGDAYERIKTALIVPRSGWVTARRARRPMCIRCGAPAERRTVAGAGHGSLDVL